MDEGRRLRLIGNVRSQLHAGEIELSRIATMGNDEAALALRSLANVLLEQAAHAMELALEHERASAADDTLVDNERPEP
jgi:hypothetical protein